MMTQPIPGSDGDSTAGDRIKLPLTFDVAKMREEVHRLNLQGFVEYSVLPLTAPAHEVDPSRDPPPPVDDYADGSWTEWLDTPPLKSSPYMSSVIDTFRQHTDVTLVRLLRLAPGGNIKEHQDPTLGLEVQRSVIRLHVPIMTNERVSFLLNGTIVNMKPGECWYLRLTDPHRVVNEGSTERVHLSVDMIPNGWVRSLIESEETT